MKVLFNPNEYTNHVHETGPNIWGAVIWCSCKRLLVCTRVSSEEFPHDRKYETMDENRYREFLRVDMSYPEEDVERIIQLVRHEAAQAQLT